MSKKQLTIAALLWLSMSQLQAQTYYGQGYTIISEEQGGDDLAVVVFKQLPNGDVKQALEILLAGTSWQLAQEYAADPMIYKLYFQQLPEQKTAIGPMPLNEVLEWIAGPAWRLVIDPVNKLVSYEVKAPYRQSRKIIPKAAQPEVETEAIISEQTVDLPSILTVSEPIEPVFTPPTMFKTMAFPQNYQQNQQLVIGRREIIAPESSYTFQNFGVKK